MPNCCRKSLSVTRRLYTPSTSMAGRATIDSSRANRTEYSIIVKADDNKSCSLNIVALVIPRISLQEKHTEGVLRRRRAIRGNGTSYLRSRPNIGIDRSETEQPIEGLVPFPNAADRPLLLIPVNLIDPLAVHAAIAVD